MSGGTIQRLGIAQAFLNQPSFVILDEPTAGLDIENKRIFYSVLERLKNSGITFAPIAICLD